MANTGAVMLPTGELFTSPSISASGPRASAVTFTTLARPRSVISASALLICTVELPSRARTPLSWSWVRSITNSPLNWLKAGHGGSPGA